MKLDRRLLVGCLVCFGVVVLLYALTITIVFVLQSSEAKSDSKCETYSCVQVAAQIVSYINESIDPCDDFYQFANGHYISEMTDETEDYESRSFYSTVSQSMNKKIGKLLNEPSHDEWKPFTLAKSFYRSCLNQSMAIVRHGNQDLIDILSSLGGWPVVQGKSWTGSKFDLIKLIRRVRDLGFDTDFLFELDIHTADVEKTNRRLRISKGSYENKENSEIEYMNKMLKTPTYFINSNDKTATARINIEMDEVWKFEQKLIHYDEQENDPESDENDESRDGADSNDYDDNSYYPTTIEELQNVYPYLNWLDYINAILPSGLNVTKNEPIVNWDPAFLKKLRGILKSTSNRTLTNYIVWRVIYSVYQMETDDPDETDKERQEYCINLTSEKLSIPVTLLYSRKYFNETSRQGVIDLVEDIRLAFIDMIGEVTWMDNDTRSKAIEKAQNIVAHVGYPNGLDDNKEIKEYFNGLVMDPYNFFKNLLQWNAFNNDEMFTRLRNPIERSGWKTVLDVEPNEANAYYDPSDNTIQFPVAILHELFFSVDRPRYINYASLGNTVGHEITHGFDGTGRQYDLNGNLVNWWKSETLNKFTENSECFVQQYSRYKDITTQLTVDGAKTVNENIADNGGTRAAYYAYQKWIERNGPEKLVPGIKYNQDQLFWISYVQAEGGVSGKGSLKNLLTNDDTVHAPDEFRVNGVVSNTEEFAKDFNCPTDTKMNPKEKCRIF